MRIFLLFFFSMSLAISSANAQGPLKLRKSPMAQTSVNLDDTYIKIVYSQPSKRGREIFGGIIPFGEVWRTGANEATEITITKPVLIEGKELKAGTYSMFTIPGEKEWTIIFNSSLGMWGHYAYKEEADVLRITVESSETKKEWEPFTMKLKENKNGAFLKLNWDNTTLRLRISNP